MTISAQEYSEESHGVAEAPRASPDALSQTLIRRQYRLHNMAYGISVGVLLELGVLECGLLFTFLNYNPNVLASGRPINEV